MADKIVVLNGGVIEQVGSPMDLYNHPVSPFVAGFIGSPKMNLLEGDAARAYGCATYGIRPEHITLSDTAGQWQAQVRHIERLGADAILHCQVDGVGPMVVRTVGDAEVAVGGTVWLTPMPGKDHRFGL